MPENVAENIENTCKRAEIFVPLPSNNNTMAQIHYIREIMNDRHISLSQLAQSIGVSKSAVASYLTHDLRLSKAKSIADALDIPMADLFIKPSENIPIITEKDTSAPIYCPKCGTKLEVSLKVK